LAAGLVVVCSPCLVLRPTVNKSEAFIRCVSAMRYLLRFFCPALKLLGSEGISAFTARPGGQAAYFESESILRFLAPDSPIVL